MTTLQSLIERSRELEKRCFDSIGALSPRQKREGIFREALAIAVRAIEVMNAANPNPDLSTQKYRVAWKFLDERARTALAEIQKLVDKAGVET